VVKIDSTDFVLADLPGLIEGAHEGVGLGDRFLGHAERCNAILHLVDGTEEDVVKIYKTIRTELKAYGHSLSAKPEVLALNKIDALTKAELAKKRAALEKACKHEVYAISGVSGAGITTVLRALAKEIQQRRAQKGSIKAVKPVKAVKGTKAVKSARKKKETWVP
jgi:GTP-binding protein